MPTKNNILFLYCYRDKDIIDYDALMLYRMGGEREYLDRYFRPQKINATVPYSDNRIVQHRHQRRMLSNDNIGTKNYYKRKEK